MHRSDKDAYGLSVDHQKVILHVDFHQQLIKGFTDLTVYPHSATTRLLKLHCHQCTVTRVHINNFSAEFKQLDPYRTAQDKVPQNLATVDHHQDLKRLVQLAKRESDDGELVILIPDSVVLTKLEQPTITTVTPSDMPLYNSIIIHIEFFIHKPSAGLLFQLPDATNPTRTPLLYTQCDAIPGNARLWLPCVDDIHERCTWEFMFIVPRHPLTALLHLHNPDTYRLTNDATPLTTYPETSVALSSLPEFLVVSSGELVEQTPHPSDPMKKIFLYNLHVPTSPCALGFVVAPLTAVKMDAPCFLGTSSGKSHNGNSSVGEDGQATTGTNGEGRRSGNEGDEDEDDDEDEDEDDDDEEEDGKGSKRNKASGSRFQSKRQAKQNRGTKNSATGGNGLISSNRHDKMGGIYVFSTPEWREELVNTCRCVPSILDFYSREYGSYPFTTYKLVFLDEPYRHVISTASLTMLSSHLLHPADIIDQTYETRRILSLAVAEQWFGLYIIPKVWSDLWLLWGLAGHLASQFLKHHLGTNEYLFRLRKDMERVCELDVNRPPICNADLASPLAGDHQAFIQLKAPLVLYILDKRMMKGGLSLGLHRVIPKILLSAMSGDLGRSMALNTTWFLKTCRKVSGLDVKSFADQWVYGSGCPVFHFSFQFNRKKLVVEINMRQQSTNVPQTSTASLTTYSLHPMAGISTPTTPAFVHHRSGTNSGGSGLPFTGQMTILVHEANGTPYEHVLDIEDFRKKFEVQFNTKYKRIRRSTKRFQMRQAAAAAEEANVSSMIGLDVDEAEDQQALFGLDDEEEKRTWRIVEWGEEDEESLASSTFEWIRLDTDLEWMGQMCLDQPDFMWAAQLQKDRDVVAQYEAIQNLKRFPSNAASTSLLRVVMDVRMFYRVRMEAAAALATMALPQLEYIGLYHLRRIYERRYCLQISSEDTDKSTLPVFTPEKLPMDTDVTTHLSSNTTIPVHGTQGEVVLPHPNNFDNMAEYFVQKSILLAIAACSEGGVHRATVQNFLLQLLRFNDNSENDYSDCYYISTILTALANTVGPKSAQNVANELDSDGDGRQPGPLDTTNVGFEIVLAEIERYRVMDALLSTYHNVVTVACLQAYRRFTQLKLVPFNLELFINMIRYGNFFRVRQYAIGALLGQYGLQPQSDLFCGLVQLAKSDPDLAFRRYLWTQFARTLAYQVERLAYPNRGAGSDFHPDLLIIEEEDGRGESITDAQTADSLAKQRHRMLMTLDQFRSLFRDDHRLAQLLWDTLTKQFATIDPQIQATMFLICELLYRPADSLPSLATPLSAPILIPKLKLRVGSVTGGEFGSEDSPRLKSVEPGSSQPGTPRGGTTMAPSKSFWGEVDTAFQGGFDHGGDKVRATSPSLEPGCLVEIPAHPVVEKVRSKFRGKTQAGKIRANSGDVDRVAPATTLTKSSPVIRLTTNPLTPVTASSHTTFTTPTPAPQLPATQPVRVIRLKTSAASADIPSSGGGGNISSLPPPPVTDVTPTAVTIKATVSPKIPIAPPKPPKLSKARAVQKLSAEDKKTLRRILRKVMGVRSAYPFLQPVDPIRDGCPAYYDVVRHPMDLGTMKTKLGKNQYATPQKFYDDFHLLVGNCYLFNPIGTYVYTEGQEIEQLFEQEWEVAFGKITDQPDHNYTIVETPRGSQSGEGTVQSTPTLTTRAMVMPPVESPTVISTPGGTSQSTLQTTTPTSLSAEDVTLLNSLPFHAKHCLKLVRKLQRPKAAVHFLQPVDPVALGVPHYREIIQQPMDLGTIERKLLQSDGVSGYTSYDQVKTDLDLIFHNCFVFNPVGTLVYDDGKRLEAYYHKLWNSLVMTLVNRARGGQSITALSAANTAIPGKPVLTNTPTPLVPIVPPQIPAPQQSPPKMAQPVTGMDEGDYDRCGVVLRRLQSSRFRTLFLQPVDPVRDGCPNYFDVIKHPMDLHTIEQKLISHQYPQIEAFRDDILLVFDNCAQFNQPGTYAYNQGESLRHVFEQVWKKTFPHCLLKERPGKVMMTVTSSGPLPPLPVTPSTPTTNISMTTPGVAEQCHRMLKKLQNQRTASPFLRPVDPVRDGAPTYFDVVQHPMDLGTVEKKLEAHQYPTVEAFAADVQLIFDNCFLFNPPENFIHTQGKRVQTSFRRMLSGFYKKWAGHPGVVSSGDAPSLAGESSRPATPRLKLTLALGGANGRSSNGRGSGAGSGNMSSLSPGKRSRQSSVSSSASVTKRRSFTNNEENQ
ncbi:hypothetical protein IWQ61_006334 [Dispira simplex]|nr:hypothetical protein IWQ61_006334 [Dispira simplex]